MFKVNNKDTGVALESLLLTLNIFHTLFFISTVNFEQVSTGWEGIVFIWLQTYRKTQYTQDVIRTYIRRSKDVLDIFWTPYVPFNLHPVSKERFSNLHFKSALVYLWLQSIILPRFLINYYFYVSNLKRSNLILVLHSFIGW